jgi:N-acetylglucosamine-6-phosphate deacetylase
VTAIFVRLWRTWEAVVNKHPILCIDAGTLYTPRKKISQARLIIEATSIAEVGPAERIPVPDGAERIDASAYTVTPGFIDSHIHGCGGVDVMDATHESLNAISRIIIRHGTTSFFPTTVSSPPDVLTTALQKLGSTLTRSFDGAKPLGIHLEGPFINPVRRGTHKLSNIYAPDATLFQKWISASDSAIRLVTIAPEADGSDVLMRLAQAAGLTVAMGHSDASLEQAKAAADRGIRYAVHTFNAMREFTHRDPGIIGEVLSDDRIFAEIIADGIHVHPAVIHSFARSKGPERILLMTDAISATDMPDGEYVLGPNTVSVTNGVCRDAEGRLAGSTLTQETALKNFAEWSEFSIDEAILTLTQNPAQVLGLKKKGVIEPGADADVTILDSNFHVLKTVVAGKLVFSRA